MMLRHQLAVTALALTLVGVGATGTGVALMPQPGGNGPPVPAAGAAKKDDPIAKMAVFNKQIAATERNLSDAIDQWKQSQPKVPAGELRAKAELLSAIDLLIFKSEVEVRKLEIRSEPLQAKLELFKTEKLTDEKLIEVAGAASMGFSDELRVLGMDVKTYSDRVNPRKGSPMHTSLTPEQKQKLEAQLEVAKKKYLDAAKADLERVTETYHGSYLGGVTSRALTPLATSLKAEQLTLSVTTEKRKAIAAELARLEAVPPEPAAVVALRQELAAVTASREALKAQHPEAFDPVTRSAVAMEKLTQELVELRGEVKRLRDGK